MTLDYFPPKYVTFFPFLPLKALYSNYVAFNI